MRASRGMGDINPAKMPKAKMKQRKDGASFEMFAKGGSTKTATEPKKLKGFKK